MKMFVWSFSRLSAIRGKGITHTKVFVTTKISFIEQQQIFIEVDAWLFVEY